MADAICGDAQPTEASLLVGLCSDLEFFIFDHFKKIFFSMVKFDLGQTVYDYATARGSSPKRGSVYVS